MSHRAKLIRGVKHSARCVCPTCDPTGVVTRAFVEQAKIERAAARAAGLEAPRTMARPFVVKRRPLPSRGGDRRMKRFHELREAGVPPEAAFAQVDAEFNNGGN